MEPKLETVENTGRKINVNKKTTDKKTTAKKTPAKAKGKTVSKKTEKGEVKVEPVEYNDNLSYQFDARLREAESFGEFKKDLKKNNPKFLPAYKEHAKRQRKLVNDGKTFWDHVETWALRGLLVGAGVALSKEGVNYYKESRANKELEV